MVRNARIIAPLAAFTPDDGALEVIEVSGDDAHARRLGELGLCKGRTLAVVKAGDPAIIRLGGSRFALAGALQHRILASPQPLA